MLDRSQFLSNWFPVTSENVFTLQGVVRKLQAAFNLGEELSLTRSVRYWAAEGLLRPKGAVHTGKGRSRIFEPDEVLRAGILFECSRWNVTVGTMKILFEEIDEAKKKSSLVRFAKAMRDNHIIFCFTGSPARCKIAKDGFIPSDSRSSLWLDIKRIARDLNL